MSLLKYTVKRLLLTIPIMFFVLLITFILVRMMPGNPWQTPGEFVKNVGQEYYEALMKKHGLDKPIWEQFIIYVVNLLKGDWGVSFRYDGLPVTDLISARFPITMELAVYSTLLAAFFGIKTGVFSAVNRNNMKDSTVRFIMLIGVSMPVFWLGMILQYTLGVQANLFPIQDYKSIWMDDPVPITHLRMLDALLTGRFDIFLDTLWHLTLPVFCLTFITVASITRQTRSSMLEVMELDFVRSARAKGCDEKTVINKHALRNALIPTVTLIGMQFGGIMGGAVLTETTFNLHGFGMLMIEAIRNNDYFVINALVFLVTLFFIMANLITDILYAIIDPRIRY